MAKNKESFFWVSYSDMMTSLFFIMLLLFLLSSGGMYIMKRRADAQREATEKEMKKIDEIREAANQLPAEFFELDANKRWSLKRSYAPQFAAGDARINPNDTIMLNRVGKSLIKVVQQLNEKKKDENFKNLDISYLVVIEGMASMDSYPDNDRLSYTRALSLYYLWKRNGIDFEKTQCEVQISGSGVRGYGRYNADGRHPKDEWKNQRILIQIIPKIGKID